MVKVDLGIIIDTSGSIGGYYELQKDFVKRIGARLNIHLGLTRIGVVVFSSGSFVKMVIIFIIVLFTATLG